MARYFFHIHNDIETIDEEGMDLPDAIAAVTRGRAEALLLAAESLKQHGHLILDHRIEIKTEDDRLVANVRFRDVVKVVT